MSKRSTPEDFWNRVTKAGPDECWNYSGGGGTHGIVKYQGGTYTNGRLAYILAVGPIEDGLVVRHKCDNGRCCNPAHLELGTYADNYRDMVERNRANYNPRKGSDHYRARLTLEIVEDILKREMSGNAYARKHGISQWLASQVLRGTSNAATELLAQKAAR